MKKIQVSTVQKTADVEVIFVNSPLVIKFTRAQCALESIKEKIEHYCMTEQEITDEKTGELRKEKFYNGNPAQLSVEETMELRDTVIALIDEITSALEGE
jgi:uncharacterized protein YdcH (DUF465 family)